MESTDFRMKEQESGLRFRKYTFSASRIGQIVGYSILLLAVIVLILIGHSLKPRGVQYASEEQFGDPDYFGSKVYITSSSFKQNTEFIVDNIFDPSKNGTFYYDTTSKTLVFETTRNYFNARGYLKLYFHYKKDDIDYVLERELRRIGYAVFKDREVSEYRVETPYI